MLNGGVYFTMEWLNGKIMQGEFNGWRVWVLCYVFVNRVNDPAVLC